ncbi:P-loop containing nucleoside triphosphate hydrolase protein [Lipomyces doorenjongii]|uniref:P-loop containing nucleoside triphosphate hydrolase protein n=1 Tax=Lipomyces doorenjongii TaxID=383834 RepID=UPI0034CD79EF
MDDSLYDEFGNFIGDAEDSDAESQDQHEQEEDQYNERAYLNEDDGYSERESYAGQEHIMEIDNEPTTAVVLHEDKQYYPTAEEVYGPDVEAMVQEEDTQPLSEPIIAPIKVKKFAVEEADLPGVTFSREFMMDLMNFPEQIRNVAIAGHLHHGKTALMDMLIQETHDVKDFTGKRLGEQIRYTDTHLLERDRGVSIKCSPMTLLLPNGKGKSHLFNIVDTPGHVNFVDEVASAFRLVDGVVVVVDVVEGVMVNTEQIIRHAISERLPLVLVVNKVDRLILELKLPPADAFYKIRYCIEQVNKTIRKFMPASDIWLSPEKGNVCFASTSLGFCFSLKSFAQMYSAVYGGVNVDDFALRLWGDIYFNASTRKFTRRGLEAHNKRTFVYFILEPLYKLIGHTLGESTDSTKKTLGGFGIYLTPSQYKLDPKPLLKLVCQKFFGLSTGFVDMILDHVPSPADNASTKIETTYTGPLDSELAGSLLKCDQDGPLVVHITKLFNSTDATEFYSFGRILSGTLRSGQQIRVLGEGYSLDDEEDMVHATITDMWIPEARYKIPISGVPAGNWVLIAGIDMSIVKTATVVSRNLADDAYIFKPINHFTPSVFKVAVEPVNPSELPKMLDGLRKVNKSYPLLQTKVEESGEHIILGTGELYMDCVLHDLRRLYSEIEIKVSDPVTRFCETVVDQSSIKPYGETPNKKNRISIIAEPLDPGISEDIENGKVSIEWPVRKIGKFFQEQYEWDALASRSIWAFGPEDTGPNILLDDTLPNEVDKKLLNSIRESVKQGFQWAVREGPLCEEPIRNTKFRIMDVELASEPIYRGGGQIIPTARRVCYSSFMTASPRLMEPLYSVFVTGPAECSAALYTVLQRRRGYVLKEDQIAGTPLLHIEGRIPVIDSFGFETDLRVATQGQAMCSLVFEKWQVVPGDPLDKDMIIPPLQSASGQALARDFVLKTRRRKGLSEEPTFYSM